MGSGTSRIHQWTVVGAVDAPAPSAHLRLHRARPSGIAVTSWADRKRDLYPGGRPTDAVKAVHRRFAAGPIPRLVPVACVLEVLGRRSGAITRAPLVIIRFRGSWYLVSMFGDKANWVRNVRAAGGEATLVHGRRRRVRLMEVPPKERAPILKRYLLFAIGARPHVPIHWRAALSEFDESAGEYPVFEVQPRRAGEPVAHR